MTVIHELVSHILIPQGLVTFLCLATFLFHSICVIIIIIIIMIFCLWNFSCLLLQGKSKEEAREVGGKIFTFGSYRLGVHGKG